MANEVDVRNTIEREMKSLAKAGRCSNNFFFAPHPNKPLVVCNNRHEVRQCGEKRTSKGQQTDGIESDLSSKEKDDQSGAFL